MIDASFLNVNKSIENIIHSIGHFFDIPFHITSMMMENIALLASRAETPRIDSGLGVFLDSLFALSILDDPLWKTLSNPASSKNKDLLKRNIEDLRTEFWSRGVY